MAWPSFANAFAGAPSPTGNALTIYAHRGGSWVPVGTFAHRTGAWRPYRIYPLPANRSVNVGTMQANFGFTATMNGATANVGTMQANFGFTATMVGTNVPATGPATTVINITDLLAVGETLSATVNCTTVITNCINRAIRRSGHPVINAVTTDHLTLDFEDTYWRVENSLTFPSDAMMTGEGIRYICQNWPKGMTWQNGGIQAVTKDGMTSGTGGTPVATVNRNRFHIRLQQGIKRKSMANANQLLEWNDFRIKGPLTYAADDNYQTQVLPREGQEAIYFSGMQWFRMVDCTIEQQYADTMFFQEHADLTQSGRDNNVFPGMIEVLGGTFRRPGIMNATLNTCRPPDATFAPGWWRNSPANKDESGVGWGDHPSASGQQYGLWWHGNADHPFQSIDHMRSWIDMEQQSNYGMAGDIRIGADSNRDHFRIIWDQKPEARDANTIQHFDFTELRRFRMQHIYIDGAMNISFLGSPSGVLDENNQATRTLAVGSTGIPASGATINVTVNPGNSPAFPTSGRILVPTTVGHTHVRYTGRTATGFSGCSGGVGTTAAGTVRNASNKRDGCNITAASNNVTLGAVGSLVGGDGLLDVDNHSLPSPLGMNPSPAYVRIWTATGVAVIKTGAKVGTTQWKDCTVESGTGMVLRTGQAVTIAFNSPERIPYCSGEIELDDIYATVASQSKTLSAKNCDGFKVVNCHSPYRSTNVPFSDNSNVVNFDNGVGPEPFGSNNFFPV